MRGPKTLIKTGKDLENIRIACSMLADMKQKLRKQIKAGITTEDLDDYFQKEVKKLGAECAFLGFDGFPKAICASVNDGFLHCAPDKTVLKKGDVLKIDSGVRYKGMNSDSAFTVVVDEEPKGDIKKLLETTEQAMNAGIDVIKDGVRTGDIGVAVEKVLRKQGLGAVWQLVGHGIGRSVHEQPQIPMARATKGTGDILKAGMTVCIEPMATLGADEVRFADDGWSIYTIDGSIGAHFEETVLVTKTGYEVLT